MMKDRIFSKSRIGFGFNTEVLEEILQEYLDPDIKMTDVTHPKYVVVPLATFPVPLSRTVNLPITIMSTVEPLTKDALGPGIFTGRFESIGKSCFGD